MDSIHDILIEHGRKSTQFPPSREHPTAGQDDQNAEEICIHAVALLYSWVDDSDAFANVAEALRQLEDMDKGELIQIIARMLLKDSNNIDLVSEKTIEDDDYDLDGLLN